MTIIRHPGHPEFNADTWESYQQQLIKGEPGYVYLIRPVGHNVYKVGSSTNPKRRLKSLQSKMKPNLEIVAIIRYHNCRQAEQDWHIHYGEYRLSGEWFALPDSEVEYFKSLSS